MELDNHDELLNYIEKSKKKYIFNYNKLHNCFSTCLLKTITCLKNKVDSISPITIWDVMLYIMFFDID